MSIRRSAEVHVSIEMDKWREEFRFGVGVRVPLARAWMKVMPYGASAVPVAASPLAGGAGRIAGADNDVLVPVRVGKGGERNDEAVSKVAHQDPAIVTD